MRKTISIIWGVIRDGEVWEVILGSIATLIAIGVLAYFLWIGAHALV